MTMVVLLVAVVMVVVVVLVVVAVEMALIDVAGPQLVVADEAPVHAEGVFPGDAEASYDHSHSDAVHALADAAAPNHDAGRASDC